MKKLLVVAIIAVVVTAICAAPAAGKGAGYCKNHACPPPPPTPGPMPTGIPGTWTLKFDDEFNGTALDTSRWQPGWFGTGITNPVNGLENNCYDSSNVAVSNGALSITAKAQRVTCPNGTSHPYTSGIISSNPVVGIAGYQFAYGVAEARLYLPDPATGRVNDWPGWWLGNEYIGTYPEIDIFEAGGGGTGTYHVHMPTGNPGGTIPGNWTGWHTYAINWQPGFVRWYWDGRQVAEVTSPVPYTPLYLIVSMGIPSTCCGGPIVVPNTILVDYVRVWQ